MSGGGNFWGEAEPQKEVSKGDRTSKNAGGARDTGAAKDAKVAKSERGKWHINITWPIFLVVLISVLVTSIIINRDYEDDTANQFASVLDIDNGDLKINWDRYQTVDIELTESITISESGTYHLTGALTDGSITIDAGVSEVRLLLDNVSITNSNGPVIYCVGAEDLVIESVGENMISDGASYSSDYDEDVTGAIYSKADLTFQGEGTLNITGNYQDAVVGKDDVKFNSGTYDISAADDGIRGKDSVYIVDGNININAVAGAIKTTNDTDAGKGFVLIEGGELNAISTKGKGINSIKTIMIYGGDLVFDTYDDALHSDNYMGIVDGDITINSGDDGLHATAELIIDGGTINIEKAYEGIEAQAITINGGKITVVANDDGLNAGGGADNSATTNRSKGASPFNADESCVLSINGGNIYVNSAGDGLDSNGWLYFNGGEVVVDGPTNNGNGALDAGAGVVMNGGKVLAVGSSGMAVTFSSNSSVFNLSIYLSTIYPANTTIEIKDSSDNTILNHISAKQFSHIAFGSDELVIGETYKIYLNGEEYSEVTISDITTVVGNNNQNFNNRK